MIDLIIKDVKSSQVKTNIIDVTGCINSKLFLTHIYVDSDRQIEHKDKIDFIYKIDNVSYTENTFCKKFLNDNFDSYREFESDLIRKVADLLETESLRLDHPSDDEVEFLMSALGWSYVEEKSDYYEATLFSRCRDKDKGRYEKYIKIDFYHIDNINKNIFKALLRYIKKGRFSYEITESSVKEICKNAGYVLINDGTNWDLTKTGDEDQYKYWYRDYENEDDKVGVCFVETLSEIIDFIYNKK